jgi:hypothetical protein
MEDNIYRCDSCDKEFEYLEESSAQIGEKNYCEACVLGITPDELKAQQIDAATILPFLQAAAALTVGTTKDADQYSEAIFMGDGEVQVCETAYHDPTHYEMKPEESHLLMAIAGAYNLLSKYYPDVETSHAEERQEFDKAIEALHRYVVPMTPAKEEVANV